MTAPTSGQGAPGVPAQPKQLGTERTELGQGWISGNVTQDVQFRFTNTGRPVANVRVAYSPRIKDPITGDWTEAETQFFTVTVWGQLAERAAEHIAVGDRVICGGTFYRETWESKDGNQREDIKMTATDFGASMLFTDVRISRRRRPGNASRRAAAAPDLPPPPDEPPF